MSSGWRVMKHWCFTASLVGVFGFVLALQIRDPSILGVVFACLCGWNVVFSAVMTIERLLATGTE